MIRLLGLPREELPLVESFSTGKVEGPYETSGRLDEILRRIGPDAVKAFWRDVRWWPSWSAFVHGAVWPQDQGGCLVINSRHRNDHNVNEYIWARLSFERWTVAQRGHWAYDYLPRLVVSRMGGTGIEISRTAPGDVVWPSDEELFATERTRWDGTERNGVEDIAELGMGEV